MNGEYYAKLMRQLQKSVRVNWPGTLKKGVTLHQDNVVAVKSPVRCAPGVPTFGSSSILAISGTIRLLLLSQCEEILAWESLQYKL